MKVEQETKKSWFIFKCDWTLNKTLKRFFEHILFFLILLVLIPSFLYFEVSIVLPYFVEIWSFSYFVHMSCITFLLINILGNLVYGVSVDTTIKGKLLNNEESENWTLCTICETTRPPRAWHCDICNICVLKRDHHCTFIAACVGYHNQRYFMFFVFHILCAMLYALYYNVQFMYQFLAWNNGLILIKFVLPLVSIIFDQSMETIYIFILLLNVILMGICGAILIFHLENILKGRITPEIKHSTNLEYDYGWKLNIIEVFGKRWYLTWISPFLKSPLPGDGIRWVEVHKHK